MKVFRDEIKEAFGLGEDHDDMGDTSGAIQPGEHDEHADEEEPEDESDGDEEEDSEDSEEDLGELDAEGLDYFAFEDDLGYAPL
jgi:hypothetical protein